MKKITLTLFALLLTCGLWQGVAQTFPGAPSAIPDNNPAGIVMPAVVSGLPSASSISDISVNISISHTWVGDVTLILQAPTGESLPLAVRPGLVGGGCCGDSSNLTAAAPIDFSDVHLDNPETMGNTISGTQNICVDDGRCAYFSAADDGTQVSFASLISQMVTNGSDPNGIWGLFASDQAGGDTGNVAAWSITFTANAPTPVTECGNAPELIPATGSSGLMNPSVANVGNPGIIGTTATLENVTVDLIHTFASDIEMVLVSPSGTRLALCTDNGSFNGLDVAATIVFTDASANNIGGWNSGPPLADYRAEGGGNTFPVAFGDGPGADMNTVFAGESITGAWTLEINDDAGGDTGTLNSFCITFLTAPAVGDPPIISCPADITATTDPGACGAVVNFGPASAIDPDGDLDSIVQTQGPPSGSEFPVGDTVIEFTAYDLGGNSASCSFTITVEDDELPEVTCNNIIAELDENGMVTVFPGDVASATDNCPGTIIEFLSSGGPQGSITTIFQSNNGGSNGGAVYFDVTALSGSLEITALDLNTPDLGNFTVDVYTTPNTYVGNMQNSGAWTLVATGSGVSAGQDLPSNAVLDTPFTIPGGMTMGIALVLDATHNHRYSGTGGNPAPGQTSYSNADIALSLGSAQNTPFVSNPFTPRIWNGALYYGVPGPPVPSLDFTCAEVGENTVTVQATDASGNTSTCTATITVVDNIAPEIICIGEPTPLTDTVSDSPNAAIPDNTQPGVSVTIDIAEDVIITDLDVNLVIAHTWVGDIDAVLTSPSGTQVAIFDRPGVPASTFGCSGNDVNVTLDDEATLPVEDECGGGVPTIQGTFIPNNPLSAFDGESTLGTWTLTVSDYAGGDTGTVNSWGLTYSHLVTTAPLVVELDANGMAVIDASALLAGVDEACGYTVTASGGSGGGSGCTAGVYSDRAAFDAEAGALPLEDFAGGPGGISACGTVISNAGDSCFAPGEILPGVEITTSGAPANTTVYVEAGNFGTSFDSVGSNTFVDYTIINFPNNDVNAFGFELYPLIDGGTVDIRIFGTGGLIDTQSVTSTPPFAFFGYIAAETIVRVEIEDLSGITAELVAQLAFGMCESGGPSPQIEFSCDDLGFNQVEVFVVDDSGNEATCTATVEVIDVTAPVLVCMDAVVELDENGEAEVLPEFFIDQANSFDNCGITITAVDVTDVTCDDIGASITVTVFASDADGNLASCTATLTVVDAMGPMIEGCPDDLTVDPGPLNLFYELPDYWADGTVTATDNCTDPVTIFGQDPAPGTLLPDGVYAITLTAEDEYGNVGSCTFTLTVESVLGVDDYTLENGVVLYPNPANHTVNIANATNIQLEKAAIYDINGRLVQNIDLSNMATEQSVDVSNLASGVYMVQIFGAEGQTVKRLVKE